MHKYDFEDDEVVSYYISFLKSLSLRVGTYPLELFYNEVKRPSFFWGFTIYAEIHQLPTFIPSRAVLQLQRQHGENQCPEHRIDNFEDK